MYKTSKYKIAALLRAKFGELAVDVGVAELQLFCGVRQKRTVVNWLNIEAGSKQEINHIVLPKVLEYFNLQEESQLFTQKHNELLNLQTIQNEQ